MVSGSGWKQMWASTCSRTPDMGKAWDGAFLPGRSLAVGTPSHRWEQWPVTLAQLPPAQPALTATPPSPLVLSWSVDGPESDPARPSLPGASLLLPGHTFPGAKTRF